MWLSRINFTPSDFMHADDLNNLANDIRVWKGDINGGGYTLNNVKLGATGGFQYYASPMEIVSAGDGSSRTQYDQTVGTAPSQTQSPRWSSGKDGTAETGGNAGSNFSISRYDDSGNLLGTPFSINRASGLITMGAQQWSGPVNGGGQTLSNVTISGYAADPTVNQGDMIARGASGLVNVPRSATNGYVLTYNLASNSVGWSAPTGGVPTSRQILTPLPMTGGGPLSADLTLGVNVFGASGPSHSAGLVPDPGTPAGATRYLREDGSWNVPPGGSGGGGTPAGNSGDVQFNSSGAFGANSYLHWDIANFRLGIGTSTPADALQVAGGGIRVTNNFAPGAISAFGLDYSPSPGTARLVCWGPNTTTRGSFQWIQLASDGSGTLVPMYIAASGNVGIGTSSPADALSIVCINYAGNQNGGIKLQTPGSEFNARLALKSNSGGAPRLAFDIQGTETLAVAGGITVTGNCNITGQYQVNGTPLSGGITAQTQPGRSAGTVYQNTTGKPMHVVATSTISAGQAVRGYTDGGNPPGTQVAFVGAVAGTWIVSFWVLPGNYYQVQSPGTINAWTEWY